MTSRVSFNLCVVLLCATEFVSVDGNSREKVFQPCLPYDSCSNRCVKNSVSPVYNVTIGHFNCFCDQDCQIFGDCCLDYPSECVKNNNSPQPKKIGQTKAQRITQDLDFVLNQRNQSFACVVVDQFSKGSYWMVTDCHDNWKNDEIRRKCTETAGYEVDRYLPVLGDTGWTYRNVYCAQCNNVKNFHYWAIMAKCVRSAPQEVLMGSADMMSFYLNNFCTVELQQDLTFRNEEAKLNHTWVGGIKSSLVWKKSLRSCEQNMIDYCPEGYSHSFVIKMCENYQSIVLKQDKNDQTKTLIFKNPMCARCHGYEITWENGQESDFKMEEDEIVQGKTNTTLDDSCPIWILTSYYDTAFWKLDTDEKSSKMLPAFNTNYRTSSWAPPSFSILMRFQENGGAELVYNDGVSDPVVISTQNQCNSGEIYDPFYESCRVVMCKNEKEFVDGVCVQKETNKTDSNDSSDILAFTITISLVIPTPVLTDNSTSGLSINDIALLLVEAFETVFNTSVDNVTIVDSKALELFDNSTVENENEKMSGSTKVSVTFVVLELGEYTNEEILELLEYINHVVGFNELIMLMDTYSVLVVERNRSSSFLKCRHGTERTEYTSDEYELSVHDGVPTVYVNSTNTYYFENEFQFLDWIITVNRTGLGYSCMEESRIVVCPENVTIEYVCDIYAPLNETEYIKLDNGSLLLLNRDVLIPPSKYIDYQGGYAVCLDGYIPALTEDGQTQQLITNTADVIVNWVTFGLTIASLTSLFITFATYCIFRELRSVSGWNIMNLSVALFAALLTFSVGANLTDPPATCTAIAMLLHYLYLATFFWNNVMAFDVWLTFGKGIRKTYQRSLLHHNSTIGRSSMVRKLMIKYMLYAWGMPAVVVACCSVAEFGFPELRFGYRYDPSVTICWISNPLTNVLAFGAPLALILFLNGVFFTLSIRSIRKVAVRKRRLSSSSGKKVRKISTASSISCRTSIETPTESNDNVFTFPDNSTDVQDANTPAPSRGLPRQPRISSISMKLFKFSKTSAQVNVFLYVKMSTVMGFAWAFGFLSSIFPDIDPLRYVYEIAVPLQGVFILVAFICKRRIWNLYKKLFKRKGRKEMQWKERSTSTSVPNLFIQPRRQTNSVTFHNATPHLPTGVEPDSHCRCISESSTSSSCSFSPSSMTITNECFENSAYESSSISRSRRSTVTMHDDHL